MKGRHMSSDRDGFVQYFLLVLAVIPLLIILWGISDTSSNHLGIGLVKIGVGLALYGVSGTLVIRNPVMKIAGAGAFVVIIVGVAIILSGH